jgi:hypothetical protein
MGREWMPAAPPRADTRHNPNAVTREGVVVALFVETDCAIEHDGKRFEAGGAWICDCTDGFRRGVVYAKPNDDKAQWACRGVVTTWHGEKIADAWFGSTYRGNYCRMRSVSFTIDGVVFTGRYCPDTSQAIRVRSTKAVRP